ncbi:MAG: tetratricopeptide repeat protein [Ignavibacteria bacterium]
MNRIIIFSMSAVLIFFSMTAFQCSSTELTSAKLYIQQKNYTKAKEALQKEIQKNTKSDEGYYLLGYLSGEEGDIINMMDAFNKSLGISRKFEKNIDDSRKYNWMNSFNKGVNFFNKATKAKSEDSIKTFYDKAISAFQNAITLEPDSADTYKNMSFAMMQAGRQDDAIKPLESLLKIKKTVDVYKILGQIYSSRGFALFNGYKTNGNVEDSIKAMEQYNKAIDVLEDGRKSFPEDQDVLLYLSNALISANKVAIAMETFKTGVEKDPGNQYYRYNYGTLLLQAGRYSDAVEQFSKAIEIDVAYHSAIFNLAVSYVKWGTKLREEADKEGKENPEYRKKYEIALPYLQKSVELKPEDSIGWETLAKVYAVMGRTKESKEAFSKADQFRK